MRRAVEVLEDLATLVIDAEESWRAIETHLLEVDQQCFDDVVAGPTRPADGVADSHHCSAVLRPAIECALVHVCIFAPANPRSGRTLRTPRITDSTVPPTPQCGPRMGARHGSSGGQR